MPHSARLSNRDTNDYISLVWGKYEDEVTYGKKKKHQEQYLLIVRTR